MRPSRSRQIASAVLGFAGPPTLASGPPSGSLRYAASRPAHYRPVPPRKARRRRGRWRRRDLRVSSLLIPVSRRFRVFSFTLFEEGLVFVVGQIDNVDPGVSHFIDCAVAVAHPLIRIGIVLVVPGVVVPRRHVDDGSLREHGGGVISEDVVRHPVDVDVAYIADDL